MTGINDIGPLAGDLGVTTRPSETDSSGAEYLWFKDCSDQFTADGTKFTARWANKMIAQIRRACDGMGIPRNETDDDRLLKAIQKADRPIVNIGGAIEFYAGDDPGTRAHKFRTIEGVGGIVASLHAGGEKVLIDPSGLPSQVPLVNLGAGIAIFAGLVSGQNRIRSLKAGTGITAEVDVDGSVKVSAGAPPAAAAGLKGMQVFSSNGTWNRPVGVTAILVFVTGGGACGSGGGVNAHDGGGAGGTAIKFIDVTAISSVAVTVGLGSDAGSPIMLPHSDGSGGDSTFGSHCTGGGGKRGNSGPGRGGVGTNGHMNIRGGDGQARSNYSSESVPGDFAPSNGNGGASFWGGGRAANAEGGSSGAYGSGGAGAGSEDVKGRDGVVMVLEF